MSLSDQLLTLSEQAKKLEESAEALTARNTERIRRRKAELQSSIESDRARIDAEVSAAEEKVQFDRANRKKAVHEAFDDIRAKAVDRRAGGSAKVADRSAVIAEDEALDDVAFAISAVQEAEYAILDAVDARTTADEKVAAR